MRYSRTPLKKCKITYCVCFYLFFSLFPFSTRLCASSSEHSTQSLFKVLTAKNSSTERHVNVITDVLRTVHSVELVVSTFSKLKGQKKSRQIDKCRMFKCQNNLDYQDSHRSLPSQMQQRSLLNVQSEIIVG